MLKDTTKERAKRRANKHVIIQKGGVLVGQMQVWIGCPQLHEIGVRTINTLMYEHVGKCAKTQRSKESQTDGIKQARQAYQHRTKWRKVCIEHTNITKMYLMSGHIQTNHKRDKCNHTSKWPQRTTIQTHGGHKAWQSLDLNSQTWR